MSGRYDDIMDMSYPYPSRHQRMSRKERAAQFSPFAALTGYGDIIEEEARHVDERPMLSDEEKAIINEKLRMIAAHPSLHVRLTCFSEDSIKRGGKITLKEGQATKIDKEKGTLYLESGIRVHFEDIISLEVI